MPKIQVSVLRGVCQTPAYVAYEKGFFAEIGIEVTLDVAATAWLVPQKLVSGESHFGVIPWTRVAAAEANDIPLVLLAGSGCEEAALVLRTGIAVTTFQTATQPHRGPCGGSITWHGADRRPTPLPAFGRWVGGGA